MESFAPATAGCRPEFHILMNAMMKARNATRIANMFPQLVDGDTHISDLDPFWLASCSLNIEVVLRQSNVSQVISDGHSFALCFCCASASCSRRAAVNGLQSFISLEKLLTRSCTSAGPLDSTVDSRVRTSSGSESLASASCRRRATVRGRQSHDSPERRAGQLSRVSSASGVSCCRVSLTI